MRRSAAAVHGPAVHRAAYCLCCAPLRCAPAGGGGTSLARQHVEPAVLVVTSLGERRAVRGGARRRGRRRGAKKSLFAPRHRVRHVTFEL